MEVPPSSVGFHHPLRDALLSTPDVPCEDAADDDPHPRAGAAKRCAFHRAEYKKWKDRRRKAQQRPSSKHYLGADSPVRYPPYRPPRRPAGRRELVIDRRDAAELRKTLDALISALADAKDVNSRGAALRGEGLARLVGSATEHTKRLDRLLNPDRFPSEPKR